MYSNFGKISVKISVSGFYILIVAPVGRGEIWHGGVDSVHSSMPNFTPINVMCRPCRAKNHKIALSVTHCFSATMTSTYGTYRFWGFGLPTSFGD